ncbi:MAG: PAS domain-containing protein [Deltaproteobacteria bacterium]|nr:PAS domain-containing protein [Deltaproteobacteria bacterium]
MLRPVPVIAALLAALILLVAIGAKQLRRDREALYDRYAHEREQGMLEAARGFASAIEDISEDIALAATLLPTAGSPQFSEQQLHAIATIKREYLAMHAHVDDHAPTRVTANDAPDGVGELAARPLEELLGVAMRSPGPLHVANPFAGRTDAAAWYRVFARRPAANGPAVAVVVDMSVLLGRLKLSRDVTSRMAVLDGAGAAAAASDDQLAAALRGRRDVEGAVAHARTGITGIAIVDGEAARVAGLPEAPAVAIAVPMSVDASGPWTLVVMASTIALETQERTVTRRVVIGGALVLLLLVGAAAYMIRSGYRAQTLRARLRDANRLAHLTDKAEKILDHIPSGVLALSEDKRVSGVNRRLGDRLGRSVVGATLAEAFADARPEDLAHVEAIVDRALATRRPQSTHAERIALLGTEAALHIHAVPLEHKLHDVAALLVFDDVSELRRIEQRLLHSEKLVTAGQLAAGIAHEVGTPLNVARGRVEITLSHLGREHAEASNQQLAIEQIDRVTRLLQQLLDYVRPAPAMLDDVDLAHTLRAVVELLAAEATKRGVSLRPDVPDVLAPLRADPDQVQQIVINLALNAIDASERGRVVWLRAREGAGAITLEVADQGHGIPRELQKQVFDPFFTTKKRGRGTGLGLWVVAELVRAQSAEIELDSAPGRGTTVRVTWPSSVQVVAA